MKSLLFDMQIRSGDNGR